MDYTYATVIINAQDQQQAKDDVDQGLFNTPLSSTGEEPPTHYMSSGPFGNEELNKIVNTTTWSKKIYFGQDWQMAIQTEQLNIIVKETL